MLEELDATPKSQNQINRSSKNKTIRNKLRKPKKSISFHQFSRRLPVNTTHVFVVRQPPSPPPPTPLRLIASMEENPTRKVSSSTTPSFSFLQAILDLSEKRVSPEIDEQKKREEAISKEEEEVKIEDEQSKSEENVVETSECQCCCSCCVM
jgi:hypothetical protein